MILSRTNVLVHGEPSDVHARLEQNHRSVVPPYAQTIAYCAVWKRPVGPVPGYWYFPEGAKARTLLTALGAVQS